MGSVASAVGLTGLWVFEGGKNAVGYTVALALVPTLLLPVAAIIRRNTSARRELAIVGVGVLVVGIYAVGGLTTFAWWPAAVSYSVAAIGSRDLRLLPSVFVSGLGAFLMGYPSSYATYGPGLTLTYLAPLSAVAVLGVVRFVVKRTSMQRTRRSVPTSSLQETQPAGTTWE